ncbi:hypothetical protein AMTR_s00068p00194930 [Amborella trichopoda]|uniref:Uncharacterized protein n=1 Tax=Amborella trichopoda TaxID=13333 RepID=U5DEA3_AMBTC|nr:hypothetical protein AMTR_s00068p00194930 [Amborella trichopoda]
MPWPDLLLQWQNRNRTNDGSVNELEELATLPPAACTCLFQKESAYSASPVAHAQELEKSINACIKVDKGKNQMVDKPQLPNSADPKFSISIIA